MEKTVSDTVEQVTLKSKKPILKRLASLRLTLVFLAMIIVGSIIAYKVETSITWTIVIPMGLLAVNLIASILTSRALMRQLPLLVFHVCLLAFIILVALGRLTYLKGQLELAEGEEFVGQLAQVEAGPFHNGLLSSVRFINTGFTIDYHPGPMRGDTRNSVVWLDEKNQEKQAVIGDQNPLVIHKYRFYTSFNKGFAPVFLWQPNNGQPQMGAVHLPSYPANEHQQAREWKIPGASQNLWIMLNFDEVLIDKEKKSQFRTPKDYNLVVRYGEERRTLKPEDSLVFPEGTLKFVGLSTWMGYNVFYDWTIHWLIFVSTIAVLSLFWHFWKKYFARPWEE